MNFALIPARAGSKRIPHKNVKDFCGQPLIAYSIKAAQDSGLFDDIIVSTDSPEIAELAISLGASAPFMRPKALADDFTGTREVIEHAINALSEQGKHYDYCCCIYATAPLLSVEYLNKGFEILKANDEKSFAFSVTHFDFPVQRAMKMTEHGLAPMFPAFVDARSQDLEEALHDAGQFYWGTTAGFLSKKAMFSSHAEAILLPRHLVQDIDTEEDWIQAELMYRAQKLAI